MVRPRTRQVAARGRHVLSPPAHRVGLWILAQGVGGVLEAHDVGGTVLTSQVVQDDPAHWSWMESDLPTEIRALVLANRGTAPLSLSITGVQLAADAASELALAPVVPSKPGPLEAQP